LAPQVVIVVHMRLVVVVGGADWNWFVVHAVSGEQ